MVWWLLPLLIVSNFVLTRLLAPKIKAPKVGGFSFPTAEEGKVIPYIFGRVQFAPNIVWWGDVKEDCGDDHFCSWWARMHAVLCWGPVDEWLDLTFDGRSLKKQTKSYWGGSGGSLVGPMTPAFPIAKGAGTPTKAQVACLNMFGGESKEGGVAGAMELAWGVASQFTLSLVLDKYGLDKASTYPDLCHVTFGLAPLASPGVATAATNDFHWCNNAPYPKPVQFVLRRCPNPDGLGLSAGQENINGDANPIAVLYELWTNTKYGVGRSASRIDLATWQAAAATCKTEGLGISGGLFDGQDAEEAIDDILEHINGVIRWNPSTGLWQLKLARADYVLASLPAVNPSNADALTITWSHWRETSNEIKVFFSEFYEDANGLGVRRAVRQYQNLANRQATGGVRTKEIQLPYISNGTTAQLRADQYGRAFSVPLAKVSWKGDRRLYNVAVGDVVRVTSPRYGVTDMAVRVTRVNYGKVTDNKMAFEGVEDVFGLSQSSYAQPPGSVWTEPVAQPTDTPYKVLFERTYAVPLGWTDTERRVLTLVGRSAGTYSAYDVFLSVDGGGSYTSKTVDRFTAVGLLTATFPFRTEAIDNTGFTVTDTGNLNLLLGRSTDAGGLTRGDNIALIVSSAGQELVTWETATPNGDGTWTFTGIVRAILDTPPPPTDHPSGGAVYFFIPGLYGEVEDTPFAADVALSAKFLSINSAGQLDAASATAATLTTSSRAQDPYPAARARLTTDTTTYARHQWPAATTVGPTGLIAEWSKRSRTGQTTVLQQDAADQSPFEGDFTFEVLVGGAVIVARTQTGLAAGPGATYTPANRTTDDSDGTKAVQFRVTPKNGALAGIPYTTPPVVMTGVGMTLGLTLGGQEL